MVSQISVDSSTVSLSNLFGISQSLLRIVKPNQITLVLKGPKLSCPVQFTESDARNLPARKSPQSMRVKCQLYQHNQKKYGVNKLCLQCDNKNCNGDCYPDLLTLDEFYPVRQRQRKLQKRREDKESARRWGANARVPYPVLNAEIPWDEDILDMEEMRESQVNPDCCVRRGCGIRNCGDCSSGGCEAWSLGLGRRRINWPEFDVEGSTGHGNKSKRTKSSFEALRYSFYMKNREAIVSMIPGLHTLRVIHLDKHLTKRFIQAVRRLKFSSDDLNLGWMNSEDYDAYTPSEDFHHNTTVFVSASVNGRWETPMFVAEFSVEKIHYCMQDYWVRCGNRLIWLKPSVYEGVPYGRKVKRQKQSKATSKQLRGMQRWKWVHQLPEAESATINERWYADGMYFVNGHLIIDYDYYSEYFDYDSETDVN